MSCFAICTLPDLEAGRLGHYRCSVLMELPGSVTGMEEDLFLDKVVHMQHFRNPWAAFVVLNNLWKENEA